MNAIVYVVEFWSGSFWLPGNCFTAKKDAIETKEYLCERYPDVKRRIKEYTPKKELKTCSVCGMNV